MKGGIVCSETGILIHQPAVFGKMLVCEEKKKREKEIVEYGDLEGTSSWKQGKKGKENKKDSTTEERMIFKKDDF